MIKEFKYLENFPENFIQKMMELNDAMLEILYSLDEGYYQNDLSRINELNIYIKSLVKGQRASLGRTIEGSWGLVPNDAGMDSDARVEFIFKPTYIATATLSRYLLEFPLYALSIAGYKKALYTGMIFCTHRNLQGHGYEGDDGAIEAIKILAIGKIPYLLNQYPEFCLKLKNIIDNVANGMAEKLEKNTAKGSWGEDYTEGFRSALETLLILNNKDFMESYRRLKNDGNSISKGELPW
jgi:hypothetical protein